MSAQTVWILLTTGWSFEPQIIGGIVLGCALYVRGIWWSKRRGYRHSLEWWRIVLFFAAALSLFIALESPIDDWADTYFWTHMLQHEILIYVTAPLALLSAPWMPLLRGIPRAWRLVALRWLVRQQGLFHGLQRIAHVMGAPLFAWFFFVGDLTFWHIPTMYDLTEAYVGIHYTEHALFLITALLFWGQLVPSWPFKPRLTYVGQIVFMFAATLQGNVLDLWLETATTPSYPYYAALPHTPDMFSAIVDQHLAGGIMMSFSIAASILMLVIVAGLWLAEDERKTNATAATALAQTTPAQTFERL